jgi:DNA-binding transcriptional regulator/RsmH inhibitor MraZ
MSLPLFLNSQEMTVDSKFRVGIPERFLRVLRQTHPDQAGHVGVAASPDKSIKVMPQPYFMRELEAWSKLDDRSRNQRLMLNLSSPFADLLPFDKQNRIKLNPQLCKFCGIEPGPVVVVGSINYMQIFDAVRWNALVQSGVERWEEASDALAAAAGQPAPVHLNLIATRTEAEDGKS